MSFCQLLTQKNTATTVAVFFCRRPLVLDMTVASPPTLAWSEVIELRIVDYYLGYARIQILDRDFA